MLVLVLLEKRKREDLTQSTIHKMNEPPKYAYPYPAQGTPTMQDYYYLISRFSLLDISSFPPIFMLYSLLYLVVTSCFFVVDDQQWKLKHFHQF